MLDNEAMEATHDRSGKRCMKITFLTIFPDSFRSFLGYPVIRRAVRNGLVDIDVVDIREYADGCFRAIDDSPYGGGKGLILRADTLSAALRSVRTPSSRTILLGPKGRTLTQDMAHRLSEEDQLILISGHYEGVDERFRGCIDEEISIGDYILTGGETAAMAVAEAAIRLIDGALREGSAAEESFEGNLLEYPQYTHPLAFEGKRVPDVLLSGNREMIARFNEISAIKDTIRLRPDLLPSDQEFSHSSLHRDYGNEAAIIEWIGTRLPVPGIIYRDKDYLLLSKGKGRPLRSAGLNRIIRTAAAALRMLWSLDISGCPCDECAETTIRRAKEGLMSYDRWLKVRELEGKQIQEDTVFSHGSLDLDSIIINGNGIVCLRNMQHAGTGDRYRDLASILSSLRDMGIEGRELTKLLSLDIDEEKLRYFMALREAAASSPSIQGRVLPPS